MPLENTFGDLGTVDNNDGTPHVVTAKDVPVRAFWLIGAPATVDPGEDSPPTVPPETEPPLKVPPADVAPPAVESPAAMAPAVPVTQNTLPATGNSMLTFLVIGALMVAIGAILVAQTRRGRIDGLS